MEKREKRWNGSSKGIMLKCTTSGTSACRLELSGTRERFFREGEKEQTAGKAVDVFIYVRFQPLLSCMRVAGSDFTPEDQFFTSVAGSNFPPEDQFFTSEIFT